MFKYKLKENTIAPFSFDYLGDYLRGLGIEKTSSFISSPDILDELNPFLMTNMEKMIDRLHQGFTEDKQFFLQVDADMDGYTSSAIFYSFFKEVYPQSKIDYRLHTGKQHGIIEKTIPTTADYIIIPDAGSNQYDEQKLFAEQGRQVLIMDHHIIETFFEHENVVLVNNQMDDGFTNKSLSGAGVVYKVIQAYSSKYLKNNFYKNFQDIAAVGIIADMMLVSELDNNFLIINGLKTLVNPFLKALLIQQEYSVSDSLNPNKIDIAFYIAPLINAVIRYGTRDEKYLIFKALSDYRNTELFTSTYKNNDRKETIYQLAARTAANIRGKQNREKEKAMQALQSKIELYGWHKNPILIAITSKDDETPVPKTITGLVAMELLNHYGKPTLLLRPKMINNKKCYAGSLRGKKYEGFSSFRQFLLDSGLVIYAQGHDMAAGTALEVSNVPKLLKYAEEVFKDVDFGTDLVEVDFLFEDSINKSMLYEFGNATHIYGNGIPQPKFAFELNVEKSNFTRMGKNGQHLKLYYQGLNFIKFFASKELDKIDTLGRDLKVSLVGRSQINEWQGRKSVQIIIDYIDIKQGVSRNLF